MGTEIERRFLIHVDRLPEDFSEGNSYIVEQAYFSEDPWVRIRIYRMNTPKAVLTIKGKGTISRPEVNCPIPIEKAQEMWPLAKCEIHKIRHHYGLWEVDEFTDRHTGLWLAEIEIDDENADFDKPDWLGEEVTEDVRYTNAYMATHGIPNL
jgi:adenylate cyclase